MDLNLDTLKREILEYLEGSGFAVFHAVPGHLEGKRMVIWDTEKHPDYQMFLEVARKSGARLIVFGAREFEEDELEEIASHIEACELTREERREYESRLRKLRPFQGSTCSIELAFDYHSQLYVFEVRPDWYEEFTDIEDEILARLDEDEDEGDDSLDNYFSKN